MIRLTLVAGSLSGVIDSLLDVSYTLLDLAFDEAHCTACRLCLAQLRAVEIGPAAVDVSASPRWRLCQPQPGNRTTKGAFHALYDCVSFGHTVARRTRHFLHHGWSFTMTCALQAVKIAVVGFLAFDRPSDTVPKEIRCPN